MMLTTSLPFSVQELTRLAPVAGSSMIGVDAGANTIWGLGRVPLHGNLIVEVLHPGSLRIGRHLGTVLVLRGGHIRELWTPAVNAGLLNEIFSDSFARYFSTVQRDRVNEVHWRRGFHYHLMCLLEGVAGYGHGGTVLVVPDQSASTGAWRTCVSMNYSCDDNSLWSALLRLAELYATENTVEAAHLEASLEGMRDRVSRLTQVDGALVITDQLRVLGSGAEVVAPPVVKTVRLEDTEQSIEQYGTRHRSAFRFCKAAPDAVAFVCSQDGGIKCVRNVDGEIVVAE